MEEDSRAPKRMKPEYEWLRRMKGDLDVAALDAARAKIRGTLPVDVDTIHGMPALLEHMVRVDVVNAVMTCGDVMEHYTVYGPATDAAKVQETKFRDDVKACGGAAADDDVVVECVIECDNVPRQAIYHAAHRLVSFKMGEDAPEASVYHTTKGDLRVVMSDGLVPGMEGFFGRGIYLTHSMAKANDYAPQKGTPGALRAMLQCDVIQGRPFTYPLGHFDRTLTRPPTDHDSVAGFIRRANEIVVYDNARVYIRRIMLYRFKNTAFERDPATNLPTTLPQGAFTVLITSALSEFFSKLQIRAGPDGCEKYVAVRRNISELLRQMIDVRTFVANVGKVLGAQAPVDLESKVAAEMAKCKLPAAVTTPDTVPDTAV